MSEIKNLYQLVEVSTEEFPLCLLPYFILFLVLEDVNISYKHRPQQVQFNHIESAKVFLPHKPQ
jgi:hypothetical protein